MNFDPFSARGCTWMKTLLSPQTCEMSTLLDIECAAVGCNSPVKNLAKPSEAVLPGRGGVIRTKNTPAKAQRQRVLWGEEAQRSDTQFSAPAGNGASVVCADDRVEPARQVPRDGRLPADEAPVLDRRAVLSRIRCHPGSMCSFRGVIRKESV